MVIKLNSMILAIGLVWLAVAVHAGGEYREHENWPNWGDCEVDKDNLNNRNQMHWIRVHLHGIIADANSIIADTYLADASNSLTAIVSGDSRAVVFVSDLSLEHLADMQAKLTGLASQFCKSID